MTAVVLLDRDGTLHHDPGYLDDPDAVALLPGTAEALSALGAAGFRFAVVTNQAGIARGLLTRAQVDAVNARVARLLEAAGVHIEAFHVCPHHPEFTGPCECRKPAPGLLTAAIAGLGADRAGSWLIGDQVSDVRAGLAAGVRPILIDPGGSREVAAVGWAVVPDLLAASRHILETLGTLESQENLGDPVAEP